ncbi:hypothetical protein Tco_0565419 [Tanacetum coccineum]
MKTSNILRVLRIIFVILPEHQSDTYVITMKMEILPVSTSNSTAVAGNPVKYTLLKLSLPDHRSILTNQRCHIQAFKTKKQQTYEHVGPKVTSTQGGKRSQGDDKRLYSADDLKMTQDHKQVKAKEQAPA